MKRYKYLTFFLICIFLYMFFYVQNNLIKINEINIISPKINQKVRIIHLSDLHGKMFGKNNIKLINTIKNLNADIIVFTGDLTDQSTKNIYMSTDTLSELNKFAPVFYVPGNHEYNSGKSEDIFKSLRESQVNVMLCETRSLVINNNNISIIGIDESVEISKINKVVKEFEKIEGYKILLTHYPENISRYKEYDIDIMFSGHAHGGQFILPFVGGLYAPGQGFLPEYFRGKYEVGEVTLVVSRGLGNSVIPVRLFNRPEIIVIDIEQY